MGLFINLIFFHFYTNNALFNTQTVVVVVVAVVVASILATHAVDLISLVKNHYCRHLTNSKGHPV